MHLTNFDEAYSWALETANGSLKKPHVLLGNGFSIAFDANRFSYSALLENAAEKISSLPKASKIFEKQNLKDFEKVIEKLETTAQVLIDTEENLNIQAKLYLDEATRVKQILAESIASLHADRPFEVTDEEYRNCRNFLKNFQKFYTTNYDYLLYWAFMQEIEKESDILSSNDGFFSRNDNEEFVIWNRLPHPGQNLFYLHGALHLFKDSEDGTIRKITYTRSRNKTALIEQTRDFLSKNIYPLVVAEGSASSKLKRVNESAYLSASHRSLASLGGSLVCYGLSFSQNDQHIAEAIANSKVSRMAVSVFGDMNSKTNQQMINSCNRIIEIRNEQAQKNRNRKTIEIIYFDATTAKIWR